MSVTWARRSGVCVVVWVVAEKCTRGVAYYYGHGVETRGWLWAGKCRRPVFTLPRFQLPPDPLSSLLRFLSFLALQPRFAGHQQLWYPPHSPLRPLPLYPSCDRSVSPSRSSLLPPAQLNPLNRINTLKHCHVEETRQAPFRCALMQPDDHLEFTFEILDHFLLYSCMEIRTFWMIRGFIGADRVEGHFGAVLCVETSLIGHKDGPDQNLILFIKARY